MIKIETKYTYEMYKQYYWFSLFRGKHYKFCKILIHLFMAMSLVLVILSFTLLDGILARVAATISMLAFLRFYLKYFIRVRRYIKQAPSFFEGCNTFIFDDDSFSTTQTGEMASGTGTMQYSALFKVYETRDMFYAYVSPSQAILLAKKDIVEGTPEELRTLLRSKLQQDKYILCK